MKKQTNWYMVIYVVLFVLTIGAIVGGIDQLVWAEWQGSNILGGALLGFGGLCFIGIAINSIFYNKTIKKMPKKQQREVQKAEEAKQKSPINAITNGTAFAGIGCLLGALTQIRGEGLSVFGIVLFALFAVFGIATGVLWLVFRAKDATHPLKQSDEYTDKLIENTLKWIASLAFSLLFFAIMIYTIIFTYSDAYRFNDWASAEVIVLSISLTMTLASLLFSIMVLASTRAGSESDELEEGTHEE